MPIGAAIGGAVVAGGATIGAGMLGADAQKDAAAQASSTAAANNAANIALQQELRGQNLTIAAPFYNNGLLAGNALTDLLLGTHTYNPAVVANPSVPGGGTLPQFNNVPGVGSNAVPPPYTAAQIAAMRNDGIPGNAAAAQAALDAWNTQHPAGAAPSGALGGYQTAPVAAQSPVSGNALASYSPASATSPPAPSAARPRLGDFSGNPEGYRNALEVWRATPATGTTAPPAGGVTTAPSAQGAWDAFRNSTNYNFRLDQGQDALESMWATHGALDSGAASKAAIEYNQNFAANELSNYMNLLASQQAAGLTAAGAVMGVGTNYAGNVTAQNTAAANAAANAALAQGNANAGMWGSIGQGVGQIGGALFQYGMGSMPTSAPNTAPINVNPNPGYVPNWGGF